MLDNCIPVTELPNILDKINFNKNNTVWKTYNVVDNKLSLLPKSRKGIMQYFSQIELTDKNKEAQSMNKVYEGKMYNEEIKNDFLDGYIEETKAGL